MPPEMSHPPPLTSAIVAPSDSPRQQDSEEQGRSRPRDTSPTKRTVFASLKSAFTRRRSADAGSAASGAGRRTKELVGRVQRSRSFHDALASAHPSSSTASNNGRPLLVVRDDVQQMLSTVSHYEKEYGKLLETCEELAAERMLVEQVISKTTRLENLDDLELAQQYLESLAESQEVAKLAALNKELVEREPSEEAKRLSLFLSIAEGEHVTLTKVDPLQAHGLQRAAVEIGGSIYAVQKSAREQKTVETSDVFEEKIGSMRSINAKLAEQLANKSREADAMRDEFRRQISGIEEEREGAIEARDAKLRSLEGELSEQVGHVHRLEALATSLNNQAQLAKQTIERDAAEAGALKERIRMLEGEMKECLDCVSLRKQLAELEQSAARVDQKAASEDGQEASPIEAEEPVQATAESLEVQDLQAQLAAALDRIQELHLLRVDDQKQDSISTDAHQDDLQEQLGQSEATLGAFKDECKRLKDELDRAQSTNLEYIRNVFLRYLQKPATRPASLDLLKTLFQFTEQDLATVEPFPSYW